MLGAGAALPALESTAALVVAASGDMPVDAGEPAAAWEGVTIALCSELAGVLVLGPIVLAGLVVAELPGMGGLFAACMTALPPLPAAPGAPALSVVAVARSSHAVSRN
jgi:hypothetical protein